MKTCSFILIALLIALTPKREIELHKKLKIDTLKDVGFYRLGDTIRLRVKVDKVGVHDGFTADAFKTRFVWDYNEFVLDYVLMKEGRQQIGPFRFVLDTLTVISDSVFVNVHAPVIFSNNQSVHVEMEKTSDARYIIRIDELGTNKKIKQHIQLKDYENIPGLIWFRSQVRISDNAVFNAGGKKKNVHAIVTKYGYKFSDSVQSVIITAKDFKGLPIGASFKALQFEKDWQDQ